MGTASRVLVEQEFSREIPTDRLLNLYEELLGRDRRRSL
jgi:hypothetical protein